MSTFTKLYLTAHTAPYTPATIRGTWNDTAGQVTRGLDPTKAGTSTQQSTTVARAETSATNPFAVLLYRGVSGPLAAQTISGTIDVLIGIVESSASADFNWKVHVYVTQGDSDTPRGTLLSDYTETAGVNEWPTSGVGTALNAAQTLSSLAISSGDRVVVEVGYNARNSSTSSFTGTMRYGTVDSNGVALPDITLGGTSVGAAGFITFSNAITENNPSLRNSQTVVQSLVQGGTAAGLRNSQTVVEALVQGGTAAGLRNSQTVIQVLTQLPVAGAYSFPPLTVAG